MCQHDKFKCDTEDTDVNKCDKLKCDTEDTDVNKCDKLKCDTEDTDVNKCENSESLSYRLSFPSKITKLCDSCLHTSSNMTVIRCVSKSLISVR